VPVYRLNLTLFPELTLLLLELLEKEESRVLFFKIPFIDPTLELFDEQDSTLGFLEIEFYDTRIFFFLILS